MAIRAELLTGGVAVGLRRGKDGRILGPAARERNQKASGDAVRAAGTGAGQGVAPARSGWRVVRNADALARSKGALARSNDALARSKGALARSGEQAARSKGALARSGEQAARSNDAAARNDVRAV